MRARFWMLVLLASLSMSLSTTAAAATYRCSTGSGQVYYSDRPCSGDAGGATGGTKLGTAGPVQSDVPRFSTSTYTPTIPKPPEHAKYLTGPCAQLEEAIRTGPARGMPGQTLRSLYEEFDNKCADAVRDARERLAADKRVQDRARTEQRQLAAAQQAEGARQDHQCANMRAVIADKRANMATLDQRQRELLQTMQENYNRSCLNRH